VTGELQTAPPGWVKASSCKSLAHGIGAHRQAGEGIAEKLGQESQGVRGWLASLAAARRD
jgi:hypothetical protein